MIKPIIVFGFLLLTICAAIAQWAGSSGSQGPYFPKNPDDFPFVGSAVGTVIPPPPCGNLYDFTDQCNSQYLIMRRF